MAQLISVRLQRSDNAPWGFRLQGGKDFGAPLVIQKVNGNSIAERAGLQAGDAVLRVNSTDVFNLRHKEAQDTIVRAGQNFEITIQRGSQTWKPAVIPTGNLPAPSPTFNNMTVTKTSLAASKPQSQLIGSGHNTPAKPFQNGNSDHGKLVNKQYNSPIGLYSEESIAETLSAQTEVLPTGALGVNFKKNERSYDANKSEVLKMLQEAESEPRDEPESERDVVGVVSSPAPVNVAGLRHVSAPITPPASSTPSANKPLAPGQNICADCERLIIGVFVRIKDKNLHVECFKCSTCGSSLKNVGYYNINNKLYCDIHAKLAARSNQPAPNMVPITIAPGNTISAALSSHPLPASAAPISPAASNSSGPLPPYSMSNNGLYKSNESLKTDTSSLSPPTSIILNDDCTDFGSSHYSSTSSLEDTPKKFTYLSELKINNDINNHLTNEFNKKITFKPCSSILSGPRPFSSNAAPLSPLSPISAPNNYAATLPRAQPAQGQTEVEIISSSTNVQTSVVEETNVVEQTSSSVVEQTIESRTPSLVWPPYKSTEGGPTACPLYIPPSPSNPVLVKPFKPLIYTNPDENQQQQAEVEQEEAPQEQEQEQEEQGESPEVLGPKTVPRMSICSAEISGINARARTPIQCVEHVTETIDTQILVDSLKEQYNRPPSPPPPGLYQEERKAKTLPKITEDEQQEVDVPQTSNQAVQENATQKEVENATQKQVESKIVSEQRSSREIISEQTNVQSKMEFSSNITNPVPKQWKSPLVSALTTASSSSFSSFTSSKPLTPMVSVLTIAPERAFTPVQNTPGGIVPLPEQTKPYLPPDFSTKPTPKPPEKFDPSSRMIDALTVASLRPFTPVTKEIIMQQDDLIKDLPPPPYPEIDLLGALTTAPERPFTPTWSCSANEEIPPPPPLPKGKVQPPPPPFEPKFTPVFPKIVKAETIKPPTSQTAAPPVTAFPPVTDELRSSFKPITEFGASKVVEANEIIGADERVQIQHVAKQQQAQTVVIPEARKAQVTKQTEEVCKQIEQICRQTEQVCQQLVQASKQSEQICIRSQQSEQISTKQKEQSSTQAEEVCKQQKQVCTKTESVNNQNNQVCARKQVCPKTGQVCEQQVCGQVCGQVCAKSEQVCMQKGPVCCKIEPTCKPIQPVCTQLIQVCPKPQQVCTKTQQVCVQQQQTLPQSEQVCLKTQQISKQQVCPTTSQVCDQICSQSGKVCAKTEKVCKSMQKVQASEQHETIKASRQFAGLHEPKAIPSYQKELLEKAKPKPQTPAKVEHYLEKVGTIKVQSEQFLLHAPDEIPEYQRSISPTGIPSRNPPPEPAYSFTDFAAEQEVMNLLTEEFYTDKGQKRVRQLMTRTPTEEVLAQEYVAKVEEQRKIAAKEQQKLEKERKIKERELLERKRLEEAKKAAQPKPVWKPIVTSAFQPVVAQPQVAQSAFQPIQPQQPSKVPVTTIQSDQIPRVSFQPVVEDYRPSTPSSSRPARSVTPSLINSPAPIIPYYQMHLIPTEHEGPESFLYDPKSPDISRAPTPKFDRSKSPMVHSNSPVPPKSRTPIPAGPPPNPLRAPKITEQTRPTDAFVARHALEHQQKKHVQFKENVARKDLVTAEFSEKMKMQTANLRAAATTQQSSVQSDGLTQVQRKKVVTEEYERTRKQVDIERETKVSMKPPSSPIRQVQSARGLKTYETSSGKPVPIQAQPLVQPGIPQPSASSAPPSAKSNSDACIIPSSAPPTNTVSLPNPTGNGIKPAGVKGKQAGAVGIAPRRGRGILNKAAVGGARVPLCGQCNAYVRGPFITALGKIWCPDHFMCTTPTCRRPLQDLGFVEEHGQLYCEYCFEQYLAPTCDQCHNKVKGDCLKAIGKHFHPECFNCGYCGKLFGNNPFFLEDGIPYCEADWNELFTTKCFACGFPVEAGDRWVEALSNNYHSQCFNCTMCKKNLEGQSFYAKGGRPFCKNHAR